jgi:hypothetical protein
VLNVFKLFNVLNLWEGRGLSRLAVAGGERPRPVAVMASGLADGDALGLPRPAQ